MNANQVGVAELDLSDIEMMRIWAEALEDRIDLPLAHLEAAQVWFTQWLETRLDAERKWRLGDRKSPRPVIAARYEARKEQADESD